MSGTHAVGRKTSRTLRHLGENLELYATFAVSGLLLVLELLHVVDHHWTESAILVTLLLLAVSTLRDRRAENHIKRTLDVVADRVGHEPGVRWYERRSDATPDMLADLVRFPYVTFLGISHRSLCGYLQERIEASLPLPWERLEICFASDMVGQAYEGAEFADNIATVRQEIAFLFTDPACAKQVPFLEQVKLIQYDGIASHTGSMFGVDEKRPSVVYVIHSSVRSRGDTHKGLTTRLEAGAEASAIQRARVDHYIDMYGKLRRAARHLGEFSRSIWDDSANQWSLYSRLSSTVHASMSQLCSLAEINDGDTILDLAAGTGEVTGVLLQSCPTASAVLLEGSPQMARLAKDHFRNSRQVRIALCHLPSTDGNDIDIADNKFSAIIIHQALHELAQSFRGLDGLVRWCRARLAPGGRIGVAAHERVVSCTPPDGFSDWKDPFRERLGELLRRHPLTKRHLREATSTKPGAIFSPNEIEDAFARQGLTVKRRSSEHLDITYEERQLLWHVPAVLDSVVSVQQVGAEVASQIVDEAVMPLLNQRTKPRTMMYWVFGLD